MRQPTRLAILLAFAVLYLIWGSTYLGIRLAIDSIPPFLMAGSRYLTAGLILYGIARARGATRPPAITWRSSLIVGGFLLLGGNGGVTISEQYIDTGLAAVIVATVPIYIVLLSWATGATPRPRLPVLLGLAGGFIGVGILMAPSMHFSAAESRHPGIGMLILLVASLLWSIGSLYSRSAKNADSPFLAAGQQMICGGMLLLLAGLITREKFHLAAVTAHSIWAWIYLVLIGAIIGFTAYIYLLRHCDPAKVATYAYVNPIVAVILGALFAGEHLASRTILAAALIIGSVAIVITTQQLGPKSMPPVSAALAEAD
jgi:drug/metabolite transporter (DMT)-like permease